MVSYPSGFMMTISNKTLTQAQSMIPNPLNQITRFFMTIKMNRAILNDLKELLADRIVDNMSTKDLEEYVSNDLFNYFDKLGEHEFLEEARNYWDDSFDDVVAEVKEYMNCEFKTDPREVL